MIKKLLYGLVFFAGMVSCTEDYTDWAQPQHNDQPETVAFGNGSVTSVDLIDFANIAEDQTMVKICDIIDPTSSDASYKETYDVLHLGNAVFDIAADGMLSVNDLKQYVELNYGKAPEERIITATVEQWITDGSTTIKSATSAPFNVKVKLVAPYISQHYWIVGAPSQWDIMCTDLPFSHSNVNVYDDPVFTVTFSVGAGETWFAIADEKTHEIGDWDGLLGCAEGNGNNGMEGVIARRPEIGNDGSWKITTDAPTKVRMTINMMDYVYKIEFLPNVPEYYMVGRQNGWSLSTGSAFYPVSDVACSYTSYFTGAWDCRVATLGQIADGNWNNFGSAEENGSCTTLVENTGSCIISPAEGYYTLTVDFGTMTYSWTPVDGTLVSYDLVGLIGVDGDWGNDVALTKVMGSGDLNGADTHNWSALGVTIKTDCSVKFRANGGWDVNWGNPSASADDKYVYGTGYQNWDNIPVAAGTYNIYFNDITGQFFFVKQ